MWGLALWLTGPANLPLWQRLWGLGESAGHRVEVMAPLVLAVLFLIAGLLSLLAVPRLFRPLTSLLVLVAAASSHFMWQYGVVIDATMLANVSNTDVHEVSDLMSWPLFTTTAALAGPALWWLWRRPVATLPWRRQMGRNLLGALAALALALAALMVGYQSLATLMRNHKELRYMINPLNTLYAAGWTVVKRPPRLGQALTPLGDDVALGASYADQRRPPLVVVVVGETARARNWGLNGYARSTTPSLARWQARAGLVNFSQVTSCGTNTQVSVPCMFSHLGRREGGAEPATSENLLDVLQRAGLAVLWLDNQTGCKGVCDRVPHVNVRKEPVPGYCEGGECFDEVMLKGLDDRIRNLDPQRRERGVVVVLHQTGSHGPAYHKRSPATQKPFQPECRDSALSNCAAQQVVNAYDNSIVYTDRFLGSTLKWLHAQAASGLYDTGLVYASDHGESLGENGLYLHGVPFALAPREQTHVPMVGWMSAGLQRRIGVDTGCLRSRSALPLSHDHLFHSVLGMMDVNTRVRDPALNLFAPCGGEAVSGAQAG
ncbi:MAG: phosphoethanolamine--lipid A transferase [Gemmobacter sp.]|nr:phosphoethanolamine--lipid A transferase [Gemmobacter sp.]